MGVPQNKEEESEGEDWLVTYADAITLLMAFFVMLLNFSKIDIPAFEEVAAGIANEIGMGTKEESPISLLNQTIQEMIVEMRAEQAVEVEVDDKGVKIELASGAFYKSGSADLREAALPVLAEFAAKFMEPRYEQYIIEIEGHTDDDPIHTAKFPSNWELSSGRATGVARFFISEGINPRRMKASGFAETRPKVPNRRPDGTPLKDNQAENRRVIVRVYPMSPDEKEEIERLDEIQKIEPVTKEAAPPAQQKQPAPAQQPQPSAQPAPQQPQQPPAQPTPQAAPQAAAPAFQVTRPQQPAAQPQ